MRIFYSGFEGPFHSCVEKVISQCNFMVSFGTLNSDGSIARCERLEALDRDEHVFQSPGNTTEEEVIND